MILLVAPFAALVAAHFLFRYAYYGEWLPNTYYAKHVRPWYESGFRYLLAAALETGLYILLPLAFLALRTRWQHGIKMARTPWRCSVSPPTWPICCRLAATTSSFAPSTSTGLCWRFPRPKASLCSAPRFQPACECSRESRVGRPLERTLHDRALPARALLRQRDSGILVIRVFGDTRANRWCACRAQ